MKISAYAIQPYTPNVLPRALTSAAPGSSALPGLIVSTDLVAAQDPTLLGKLAGSPIAPRAGTTNFLVVKPDELPFLVQHEHELALFKTVLKSIVHEPVAGRVIDAAWIVFGAYKLRAMIQSGAGGSACFWQFADLAASTTALAGQVAPSMKLPDAFANGISFVVSSGGALSAGKAIPFNEMGLSKDERNALPLAAIKALGFSLDDPTAMPAWLKPGIAPVGLPGTALAT
jgi:hypothetical protein